MNAETEDTDRDTGPRLSVWAPYPDGPVPTLDPDCLYAASLFQARVRRGTLTTPSTLVQSEVPCLEDASGVMLAEGVDGIDTYSEVHHGSSSSLLNPLVVEGGQERQDIGRKALLLLTYLERELQPLIYHILFSPRLFAAHTYRAYARGMGFAQRKSMPQRLQSAARHKVASTEYLRSRNALFTGLTDSSRTASTLTSALRDEGGDDEAQDRLERERLAQRAGIRFWPFGLTDRDEKARRGQVVKQRAEAAFGQAKVLQRLEAVLDVVTSSVKATGGDGGFLFGQDKPTKVDVRLFSLLAPLLHLVPLEETASSSDESAALATVLLIRNRYPLLVDYVERVRTHIWQAEGPRLHWPSEDVPQDMTIRIAQTLGTLSGQAYLGLTSLGTYLRPRRRRPAPPSTTAREGQEKSKPEQKTERERKDEAKIAWGRAVWIASAVVGVIGTAFASGLLEISFEADEDEENEDEVKEGGSRQDEEEEYEIEFVNDSEGAVAEGEEEIEIDSVELDDAYDEDDDDDDAYEEVGEEEE
ncbi:hypothetical protein FA10DRAFT_300228 [Acaromyces ingoldii]|uniref:Mitochondrial outer membrane transport complex Sam37/metaxin N-terminal domain-containing protein n=1 Tax=Acaromyces ingoldii TaxID=215250 RepID=A0A316YV83_9BASI|nr:hypothetical protein FA10DRAFT_300228 [Acaromyces ingoldii]PWN91635.1 hypothetical protein FA10DRAFT_300228 [Acaromyces ingoldii]